MKKPQKRKPISLAARQPSEWGSILSDLTEYEAENRPIDDKVEGFHNMMHRATWSCELNIAKKLLSRSGGESLLYEVNMEGAYPLTYAIAKCTPEMVELILNHLKKDEVITQLQGDNRKMLHVLMNRYTNPIMIKLLGEKIGMSELLHEVKQIPRFNQ